MRTFGELKYDIGERIHDTGAERLRKIGKYLNSVYQEIWNAHLWRDSIVFDLPVCVDRSDGILVVPEPVREIISITQRAWGGVLSPSSAYVFQRRSLEESVGAVGALGYTAAGSTGVWRDLAAPARVRVASEQDADVVCVVVYGTDAYGLRQEEALTVNGMQTVESQKTFYALDGWTKAAASAGALRLEAPDGTVLDRMEPRSRVNRYLKVKLAQAPAAGNVLYVTGKRRPVPLVRDEDVPQLPVDAALFSIALAEILREAGKYAQAVQEENRGWRALDHYLTSEDVLADRLEQTLPEIRTADEDRGI